MRKPFPLPLVAADDLRGTEDETLDYMSMPKEMATYRPPVLPEAEAVAGLTAGQNALRSVLALLQAACRGETMAPVSLLDLGESDRGLVNQVLAEGEVSAIIAPAAPGAPQYRVQESVFAGVWRVVALIGDRCVADQVEVGPVPQIVRQASREDDLLNARWQSPSHYPDGVMNAPSLLAEIDDQIGRRRQTHNPLPPHVINLTLLPLQPQDLECLDDTLGNGRVGILSRGYGNCRIANTAAPGVWRVMYFNSQDAVILNTLEITAIPEVALAAPEDLQDSLDRLQDVMDWVAGAHA